ncbi:uncharacterized protein B0H18DRAFT_1124986 [Fomitopsis serialis]|uniref:uncharacterized protein n=1 Tax=Fomitopsis serialis TaxID=139415 RepID=UPI002008205C|nr:uncharacterized protein B0H18DRAFT_1124986 [Neoantrodia serialis]KAH9915330.1 hypothetical protein B0H18DRAFT_1124986 [Neoantrodia serialis]
MHRQERHNIIAQPSPYIPPELVEHIIDFNFADTATLIASSRVARAWAPATRHHLFSSLNLKSAPRILAFADILRASPSLARAAREVRIPAWLSKLPTRTALSQIFEQLRRGGGVKCVRCTGQQLQPVWYELLGSLHSVESVKLKATWCDLDALDGLLRAFPRVRDVFVETRMLSGVGDVSAPAAAVVPLPELRRMVVFNASGLPNDFQSILLRQGLPRLESIEAQFGSVEDVVRFHEFLDKGGYETIKDLHMDFTYECPVDPSHDANATLLLSESVRKCNLRSLGLKCDHDFARIWEATQEALQGSRLQVSSFRDQRLDF